MAKGNPHCMDFYCFHFSFKKEPSARSQKTNSCCRSGHLHGPWRSAYLLAWKGCQLTNPTAWTESWLRGVQHSSHTHTPPKSSHATRTSSMLLFQGYHYSGIQFCHDVAISNFWNKGVLGTAEFGLVSVLKSLLET